MADKDKKFGSRLKKLRKIMGITQQGSADMIGIKISAVQSHEAGQWPNRSNLERYIEFYGCENAWLMTGVGPIYKEGKAPPGYVIKLEDHSTKPGTNEDMISEKLETYTGGFQADLLKRIIIRVERNLKIQKKELEPEKKAELFIILYEYFTDSNKAVENDTIRKYIKLVA